jgi:hypothetical protein
LSSQSKLLVHEHNLVISHMAISFTEMLRSAICLLTLLVVESDIC